MELVDLLESDKLNVFLGDELYGALGSSGEIYKDVRFDPQNSYRDIVNNFLSIVKLSFVNFRETGVLSRKDMLDKRFEGFENYVCALKELPDFKESELGYLSSGVEREFEGIYGAEVPVGGNLDKYVDWAYEKFGSC